MTTSPAGAPAIPAPAADRPMGAFLHQASVDAALRTAAELLGVEVVFIGSISGDLFRFERVLGSWPGMEEGACLPAADSMCSRLLAGAPSATADAAADPAYRDAPARSSYGITSYAGVPVIDSNGAVLGTLCGVDRNSVAISPHAVAVLRQLADVVAAYAGPLASAEVVISRTEQGWAVAGEDCEDLTSAMVLADLLAADVSGGPRPPRPADRLDELAALKLSVVQLEHALAARVVVEQAIGVLAERHRVAPRIAFERLRKAARSRGRKVHDLAREVVASATERTVPLPPELMGGR